MMHIYFASQFNEKVSFNVTEELSKGEWGIKLSELFSEETVTNGLDLYQKYHNLYYTVISLASVGSFLVLGLIGATTYLIIRKKRKKVWKRTITVEFQSNMQDDLNDLFLYIQHQEQSFLDSGKYDRF